MDFEVVLLGLDCCGEWILTGFFGSDCWGERFFLLEGSRDLACQRDVPS